MIRASIAALSIASIALLLGCAKTPLEQHWGDAYRENKNAMIANPDAGSDEPIEGLDPLTGELVVERYEREQLREPQKDRDIFLIDRN